MFPRKSRLFSHASQRAPPPMCNVLNVRKVLPRQYSVVCPTVDAMAELPSSNVICRYFLENTCLAGDKCKFIHDVKVGVLDDECRYYRIYGRCRYGRQCSYDHVRHNDDGSTELVSRGKKSLERDISRIINPPENWDSLAESTPPALLPLCKEYETAGKCSLKKCSAVHGGLCRSCEKYVIHPHNRYFNLVHESQCRSHEATVPTLATYLLSQSADLMCSVCLDIVYEKPGKGSKRFGILSSCPHVLCVQCAETWRKVKKSKSCPECRTISAEMKPSVFHVKNGEVKDLLFPQRLKVSPSVVALWPAQPVPHVLPVNSIPTYGAGWTGYAVPVVYGQFYPTYTVAMPPHPIPPQSMVRANLDGY